MRRIFKTKTFNRWMRKLPLSDKVLLKAVDEMEHGLVDADLGGNDSQDKVYKKRIALPGKGKSGGTRTIVATNKGGRWFFLYGFEKHDKDNITMNELASLRDIAEAWLAAPDSALSEAIAYDELVEICDEYQ
jgi:hypothetical protein